MRIKLLFLSVIFSLLIDTISNSQNIPSGFPVLNDYLRREQVLGNISSDYSFIYRPILTRKAFPEHSSPYLLDSTDGYTVKIKPIASKGGGFQVAPLPVQLTALYNSHHPSNSGHGAILPAKGLQTLLSAGVSMRWGILSVQLYPQLHYSQNLAFEEYPTDAPAAYFTSMRRSFNGIDQPIRFGQDATVRALPGNSNVSLNLGGIALGVSTENLWIGPGQKNSLLMSDVAEGFLHFKINSTKPLKTFAGNFEGVYWVGKLDGSNRPHFSDGSYSQVFTPKEDDWRYFTGLSITYSPIFLKGLSIGGTRAFQVYRGDMRDNLRAYFPLFAPLPKEGEGVLENVELREDQNVGIFARYLIPKAMLDFYFEFSRNDHPLNWRDLIMNIEHNRGYLIGFNKYFQAANGYAYGISAEMTQTQFSINNIIRWGAGIPYRGLGLYDNYQVRHGFTNKGENLGAGTGVSGNQYSLKVGRYKKFEEISIEFDRLERHPNYYYLARESGVNVQRWIEYGATVNYRQTFGNLIFSGAMTPTLVTNFNHWNNGAADLFSTNSDKKFNLNILFNVAYLL
jgi:hypothetical protein